MKTCGIRMWMDLDPRRVEYVTQRAKFDNWGEILSS